MSSGIPWPDLPPGMEYVTTGDPVVIEGPELEALLGFPVPRDDDPLWWLSFCDPAKTPPPEQQRPGGLSFLGVVITQAPSLEAAITRSHVLGVNPGGEIGTVGPIPAGYIAAGWRDRLLTAEDVESIPPPAGLEM
jgi:hypothetical protein